MNQLYHSISPTQIADWHPADIVAALRKAGGRSLRQLSKDNGYAETTLRHAIRRPYPAAEKIISAEIGVHPAVIWPTRYDSDGVSKHTKRGRPKKMLHEQSITTVCTDA